MSQYCFHKLGLSAIWSSGTSIFNCCASNFSFSLVQWARYWASCVAIKSSKEKLEFMLLLFSLGKAVNSTQVVIITQCTFFVVFNVNSLFSMVLCCTLKILFTVILISSIPAPFLISFGFFCARNELYSKRKDRFEEECKKQLVGNIVLTRLVTTVFFCL